MYVTLLTFKKTSFIKKKIFFEVKVFRGLQKKKCLSFSLFFSSSKKRFFLPFVLKNNGALEMGGEVLYMRNTQKPYMIT